MDNSQVAPIISLIVKSLIGEVCSQTIFSYGDELILHFGDLSNHTHPKLTHLKKGKWELCTRTTNWLLTKQNRTVISSSVLENLGSDLEQGKELIKQLENKKLLAFEINRNSFHSKFIFEDNYDFYLECDIDDDSDLAHFELFMPEHKVLVFGPKLNWEFKSSLSKEY